MSDPKPLGLFLFDMGTVSQYAINAWKLPGDERRRYAEASYWKETAQLLEHGRFDGLFLADIVGVHDVYGDGLGNAARESVQFPNLDPFAIAGIVAGATEHLGIGVTASTSYSQPFDLARRFSSLDLLSNGRIGWNIVLSHTENSSTNFGLDHQLEHGRRYAKAQEFLDVVFKLWEGSWDEGAVVADRRSGVYADPDRVHYIDHRGEFFSVRGPHLAEPSRQRTPVLFQATGSDAGLQFASANSEFVFTAGPSPEYVAGKISDIARHAEAQGKQPGDVKTIVIADIIVGRDDAQVAERLSSIDRAFSLAHQLGKQDAAADYLAFPDAWTLGEVLVQSGFEQRDLDAFAEAGIEAITGRRAELRRLGLVLPPGLGVHDTVADAKRFYERFKRATFFSAGTPERVADDIERWLDVYGIDAINLRQHLAFDALRDFVDLVVPELQRRGRLRTEYRPNETLRERLFVGHGPLVDERHPAARFRGAFR